jgi:phosphoribosylaminoimidazolecarboxamide formyltransferase/IMP cyclohydrolase
VRGISDYGDPSSKDGRYKDKFHILASIAAAEVAKLFLEMGYTASIAGGRGSAVAETFQDTPPLKVKTVLMTMYSKEGILPLLDYFKSEGIGVIATPNTSKYLKSTGYDCTLTHEFTQSKPISFIRGTLHPYILAAIAANRLDHAQVEELKKVGINKIDLVFVNTLDPLVTDDATTAELLEQLANIQTGGPSLLRWAIKQWRTCTAVVNPADYPLLLRDLKENHNVISPIVRARLLSRALQYLADKDSQTARLLNGLWPGGLGA